jgi:hypothetical protein
VRLIRAIARAACGKCGIAVTSGTRCPECERLFADLEGK